MPETVLILGAGSAIAHAAAFMFARRGYDIVLAGRDVDELERMASDLHIRTGVRVVWELFNADFLENHQEFLDRVLARVERLQGVLLAVGDMGDHDKAVVDIVEAEKIIRRNYLGAVSILTGLAKYFADRREGFIIGITSVAGERGRQSNYVYGSAKGGLDVYLQGLRNRLFAKGVRVISVRPGFVDTAMTFGLPGLFLVASPEYAGRKIVRALDKRIDIVYIPWFWRYILVCIRAIPEFLFKRLSL